MPKERIEFPQFPSFRGTFPLYQEGILYCNVVPSKGAVLNAFLDKVDQKPSRIVFIDDSKHNLLSVEEEMKKRGIPFLGLHYVQKAAPSSSAVADSEWDTVWECIRKRASQTNLPHGIIQTGNVEAIQWALQNAPEDSLIIFDVGGVLLVNKDAVLHKSYQEWITSWIAREAPEVDETTWRMLSSVIAGEAPKKIVNDQFPGLINEAKTKNKTIALTKRGDGDDHRLKSLNSLGIDFGEPFRHSCGWYNHVIKASYSNGFLQTEAQLKGPVLLAFLSHLKWHPKAILFVDDQREQCESILAAAKGLGIPALCIHYTEAIENIPPLNTSLVRCLMNDEGKVSDFT